MRKQLVNLDIVRIFAMLMVLSIHIGQRAGIIFDAGAKGVQLFFVLSGYLAFVSLDRNSSAKEYYKKRLIRIIPIYWFCLILIYIEDIVIAIIESSTSDLFTTGQCSIKFLRYFFFLQCFLPSQNWNLWNNHSALWTMSSFAGFYILAPILYKLLNNFHKIFITNLILLFANPYIYIYIKNVI